MDQTSTSGMTWAIRFRDGAEKFQKASGAELIDLFKELMRVYVEKAYHWTAPPTQGQGQTGRSGGLESVEYDINRFAVSVNQSWLEMLYKRFGPGPVTAEYRTKAGKRLYLQDAYIESDAGSAGSRLGPYHQTLRDSRGRVRKTSRGTGDWRNIMIVPKSAKDKYIKDVKKRVGKMKSGWIPALYATNSKLPPAWVESAAQIFEASGKSNGYYDDSALDGSNWTGYITAENDASYFRDHSRFLFRARDHIENFVMKPQFEKWIQRMIDKHGAK